MIKKSMMHSARFFAIFALMFAGFVAFGNSAQAQTSPTPAITQSPTETATPEAIQGPWWAEAQAFAGCYGNGQPSYSGTSWDLKANQMYTVNWDLTFVTSGGSSTSYSNNQQTLQASSTGYISTSTFHSYAGSSTTEFRATMNVYDSSWNRVAYSTSICQNA